MHTHHQPKRPSDLQPPTERGPHVGGSASTIHAPETARVSLYLPDGAAQAVKRLALVSRRRPNAVFAEAVLAYVQARADEAGVSAGEVEGWREALGPRRPPNPEVALDDAAPPRVLEGLLDVLGQDGGAALRRLLGLPDVLEPPAGGLDGGSAELGPPMTHAAPPPLAGEEPECDADVAPAETVADKRRRVERVKAAICHELLLAGTDLSFATLMSRLTEGRRVVIGGMRPRVNLNTIVHHDTDRLFEVSKGMVWLRGIPRRPPGASPPEAMPAAGGGADEDPRRR